MKKLNYFVWLILLCISCTKEKRTQTSNPQESYKVVIDCNETCSEDITETIKTENLDEILITSKPKVNAGVRSNVSKFKFKADESVTLVANHQTKISIPPNSFRYVDSKRAVEGDVLVEVKEYYKKSEFIKAKLTSQTKDELLESRGMIHVSAKSNGKECELITGKQLKVDFPTNKFETGFQYFSGQKDDNDDIIWDLVEPNVSERPDFASLNPRVINTKQKRVEVSFKSILRRRGFQSNSASNAFSNWMLKEFIKDFKDTSLEKYNRIREGKNKYIYKRLITFDFDTGTTNGITKSNVKVKTDYFLDLKKILRRAPQEVCMEGLEPNRKHLNMIVIDVEVDTKGDFDLEKFEREYSFKNHDGYIDYVSIHTDNLNWINCDRFLRFKKEDLTPMIVDIGESDYHDIKLVFKNRNAVMRGAVQNGKIVFNNIPKDEDVYLIGTKLKGEANYFSVLSTKVSEQPVQLHFQPYTKRAYSKALETIDKS